MKIKYIFIILTLLITSNIILISCGGGEEDEEQKLKKFEPIEDLRKDATPPVETSAGVNFSVYAPKAKYVSIVGDFNNWIDNRNVMKKNRYGVWSITIPLKKGTYSYKFNIDGVWIIDPKNPNVVKDKFGDMRSVIEVKQGVKFYEKPIYSGFTNAFPPVVTRAGVLFTYNDKFAKRVSVAGTFNNWEKDQYFMSKNQNGIWSIVIQLPRGKYYYKFNVDGIWKYDPENPQKVDDKQGDYKSVLEVKFDIEDRPSRPFVIDYEIVRFEYYSKDLPSYIDISVVGNFNDWREGINIMTDKDYDKIWFTTVRLTEGEYYYKFSIEGEEFLDPQNPVKKITPDGKEASYLKVVFPPGKLNVKFSYGNDKAKEVYLVGDFNNWNPEVDKMKRDENGIWYITKFLSPGRYAYQFIVDGEWILDPANPNTVMDMNSELNSFLEVGGVQ